MKRLIKKSHFDNLSSMRFLAFLGIFVAHAVISFNPQITVAKLFVDVRQFTANINVASYSLLFILTGFLNTWSIFEERFIYQKVNILRLMVRRFLGILPLYVLLFFFGYYILPLLNKSVPVSQTDLIPAWQYFSFSFNFFYTETWNPLNDSIGNMWSIAVTVQYILVWPMLMRIFRRNETSMFVLMLVVWAAGYLIWGQTPGWSYNTLNFLPEFAIGGYAAYISFFKYPSFQKLRENTQRTNGFTYLCFFGYLIFRNKLMHMLELQGIPQTVVFVADKLALSLTLGYFVFEQNFGNHSVIKLAKLKFMKEPGRLSFGLYAYMSAGIVVAFAVGGFMSDSESMAMALVVRPLIALVVTAVLAVLSNEYYEKKFSRQKKNYNPTREYNPVGLQDAKTKSA